MRADSVVIVIHNLLGGPISRDYTGVKTLPMFLYTAGVIGMSVAFFTLCLCDLHHMLYSRDLVLSVIDLLMLLGIATTVFTIQSSSLIKHLYKSGASLFQCLADIDGHLYALNMRRDPAHSFSSNCLIGFACASSISLAYLLANVLRIKRTVGMIFAFKTYGLFVVFLMHGLFLVFSYQIWQRIRYMVKHLEKMIATINRQNDQSIVAAAGNVGLRFFRDLKMLAIVHSHCFRAVTRLNEECGLANVSIFGMFFYVLTAKSFQLFYICSIEFKRHGFTFTHVLEPTVLIIAVFSYFFATTYLGEMVLRETQLVINNLHKLESLHKTDQSELVEQLGNQIMHQTICFNVINFFQIDLKFFHQVMASVATYLIILLQFDFQN
uniref:Gustatory receptor n=1 Tax=Anopheles epiroticus TaxID=199890 RepID=A0A182PAJ4_9DIPT